MRIWSSLWNLRNKSNYIIITIIIIIIIIIIIMLH